MSKNIIAIFIAINLVCVSCRPQQNQIVIRTVNPTDYEALMKNPSFLQWLQNFISNQFAKPTPAVPVVANNVPPQPVQQPVAQSSTEAVQLISNNPVTTLAPPVENVASGSQANTPALILSSPIESQEQNESTTPQLVPDTPHLVIINPAETQPQDGNTVPEFTTVTPEIVTYPVEAPIPAQQNSNTNGLVLHNQAEVPQQQNGNAVPPAEITVTYPVITVQDSPEPTSQPNLHIIPSVQEQPVVSVNSENNSPQIFEAQPNTDRRNVVSHPVILSAPGQTFSVNANVVPEEAKNAHYYFASIVDDNIAGSYQHREEKRDGLKTVGYFAYDDGNYRRAVNYEADQNGFRIIKDDRLPSAKSRTALNGIVNIKVIQDGTERTHSYRAVQLPKSN